jgi:prepilin-type N-terminal cleavage/methylation domain-containing protein
LVAIGSHANPPGLGVKILKTKQKGFTLIELLVVIAIIGLLASVVLLALNSARQKSRDAKRLADVRQIASALELYFNDNNAYPGALASLTGTWLGSLPTFPTPADGCNTASYSYTAQASNASTYALLFCVSAPTGGVTPAGTHTLTQGGIQ